MQRLQVSSGRFLYFIDPKEKDWLEAREQMVYAINDRNWEKAALWRTRYEKLTVGKSSLHRQFLMLADAITRWQFGETAGTALTEAEKTELMQSLQEAWLISQQSDLRKGLCPKRMSFTELFIRSLYLRIWEEQEESEADKTKADKPVQNKTIQVLCGYQELLGYIKKRVNEREQVMLYPQIAYRCLLLLADEEQQKKATLYKECMDMLRRQGGLYSLTDLLNWHTARQETNIAEELRAVLLWLYQTYQIKPSEWLWYLPFGLEEVYRIPDIIQGRRKAMEMLQQELAYGTCDVSVISHLENGDRAPKRGILVKLFSKLRFPSGNIVLSAQTGNSAQHRLLDEIRALTMFSRHEEAAPLLEELKKHMRKNRFSKQYVEFELAENKRARGKINDAEHQELLWNALYLTVPRNSTPEKLKTWIFTRTEAMIINCLSYSCEEVGKRTEQIAWLRVLKEHYERQPFSIEHYMDGYELTLRNLGNLLGNQEEFEEAIEVEDIAIRLALRVGQGDILRLTLYDRAWNMEQLWESGIYTKEESRPYMKAALMLNQMLAKPETVQRMKKHWNKYYEEN